MKTEDYRNAPSGFGPLADEWKDKPHRLLYDLAKHIDVEAARTAAAVAAARLAGITETYYLAMEAMLDGSNDPGDLRVAVHALAAERDAWERSSAKCADERDAVIRERDALRAAVATQDEAVRYWTAQAQHEANEAASARAQVEAARATCARFIDLPWLKWAGDAGRDVLAAMDGAKP